MPDWIERRFRAEGCDSRALYSRCGAYRYGLERVWGETAPVLFVMLNPSTATEESNDPTIERCQRRARAMGCGGVRIANLFAFRATRPEDLKRAADPVGPLNDRLLRDWSRDAVRTVAAWGVHGAHRDRDRAVLALLDGPLTHLGLTKAGHPRHPLYVPYTTTPEPWETPANR